MKLKTKVSIFCLSQETLKKQLHKKMTEVFGEENVVNEDGFLYAKGEHPVLLVAHLDTVHKSLPRDIFINQTKTKILSSEGIGGDDRCGVIIILDILEKLKCSVVFCEDEEIGCVGAKKFCDKKYDLGVNYAVEFDRKGSNDYVFYKDFNPQFEEHIKKFGFVRAYGSCSDISHIATAYEIEAVNISSGYFNPHTLHEYVDFEVMDNVTNRAIDMISVDTGKFEYKKPAPVVSYKYSKVSSRFGTPASSLWGDDYPVMVFGGQFELRINDVPTEFDSLIIDSDDKISALKIKGKDFKLKKSDKAELWSVGKYKCDFRARYWTVSCRYPDQEIIPNDTTSSNKYCLVCGAKIDEQDEEGLFLEYCPTCRALYYGVPTGLADYYDPSKYDQSKVDTNNR